MTTADGDRRDGGDPALQALRAERERWVRSPRGPLALVNSQTVTVPQPVWPVPGTWAPAIGGLSVTATADAGVVVDDVLIDGTVHVAGDDAVVASAVRFADGTSGSVAATTAGHALRVWDPASPAIARFGHIGVFPVSTAWVRTGVWEPGDREGRGSVTDAAGAPLPVAGTLRIRIGVEDRALVVVRAGDRLQLVFQDATSGERSYSMGRFLFLDDPGAAGAITVDFNRAVLPPCAFSYQYACPVPPPENRLPVPVEAGETHGYDVDGAVLH
ncbi:DUF1684 domain-containing protein [Curtobacterium sp. MCBD17_003]|uniref:DUF1684 domain-containing protein n=1 Tax=Curtobacterium sp. MCBD17_003 TaxID=2175667 RepID=UPI000DA9146B|nr:DUF1684 domain-containing protein [Curtobacterium sp. MCBD17_003]WIE55877.1 DUF1684 domain-containing protein [Curtobacterium sp. MCBD17_003]